MHLVGAIDRESTREGVMRMRPHTPHAKVFVLAAATLLLGACAGTGPRSSPALPAPSQSVITSADGRWELQGRGTGDSPHYWAWIPAGATPPAPPAPPSVPFLALQRIVKYPNGQWELRGQGTTSSPYFWVWASSGGVPSAGVPPASSTAPPPPAAPPAASTRPDRVVMRPDGRWELFGQGTTDSPYYWVWVPAGAVPSSPPPVPPRTSVVR